LIAACIFRAHPVSYSAARHRVAAMSAPERRTVIDEAMRRLGPHDTPLRELESAFVTFDVLVDQGAYFDLKRNRMMTQVAQPLVADYGYEMPRDVVEAGMERPYREAIEASGHAFEAMRHELPEESRYVLTNAHRRRVLLKMNLRELYYFVRLRGAPKGHFAYRIVALRCGELARERYPLLGAYLIPAGWPTAAELRAKHFA
jgi:thymidylate synthase ThyX